jgi:hypothetical protein
MMATTITITVTDLIIDIGAFYYKNVSPIKRCMGFDGQV